jgi:hypothetical protein
LSFLKQGGESAVYDGCMHRWLLLVMIALLPRRGWVGDAMAGQMLDQRLAAIESVQAAAAPALAHEDCMGHAAPSENSAPAAQQADCPTCASCQVCSSVAMVFSAAAMQPVPLGSTLPTALVHRFASAEPAPALKPPIS